MPNSRQHQEKAEHNRSFLDSIDIEQYPDWAAVAAFYTAVHLVERLRTRLSSGPGGQHSTDHQDRLAFVQRHHRRIHQPYHELFNASTLARYETLHSFNTQITADDVRDTLVNQDLVAIETYVAGVFAPPPPSAGP